MNIIYEKIIEKEENYILFEVEKVEHDGTKTTVGYAIVNPEGVEIFEGILKIKAIDYFKKLIKNIRKPIAKP